MLLPRVRAAAADTILVSDGFSCREQVRQVTDRRMVPVATLAAASLGRASSRAQLGA